MKTKQSNGEMVVNSDGGVGVLGTYGDITKAAVEVGKWHRVVMAVKCASGGGNKGELRTWVDTVPAAVVSLSSEQRGYLHHVCPVCPVCPETKTSCCPPVPPCPLQVRSEDICTGGRFEIDCESLFLFSSTEGSMMPGNISLRTVRVEQVYR